MLFIAANSISFRLMHVLVAHFLSLSLSLSLSLVATTIKTLLLKALRQVGINTWDQWRGLLK